MIINILDREYLEGKEAVKCLTISFMNIPILMRQRRTSNKDIVASLECPKESKLDKPIKGFRYEAKNQSKKIR